MPGTGRANKQGAKGSIADSKVEARKKFNLLAACQKNKTECGQALVVEYEDNRLISDEDDVKRVKRLRSQWLQRHKEE